MKKTYISPSVEKINAVYTTVIATSDYKGEAGSSTEDPGDFGDNETSSSVSGGSITSFGEGKGF